MLRHLFHVRQLTDARSVDPRSHGVVEARQWHEGCQCQREALVLQGRHLDCNLVLQLGGWVQLQFGGWEPCTWPRAHCRVPVFVHILGSEPWRTSPWPRWPVSRRPTMSESRHSVRLNRRSGRDGHIHQSAPPEAATSRIL